MSSIFRTPTASYEEVSLVRSGPSSSTHLVRRSHDGARFVLKQLDIRGLRDWKQFDLFEREIAALRSIDHPQIPRLVDSYLDEEGARVFLVQSFVEGMSFREVLAARGALNPAEAESYLRQALEILDFLHRLTPPVIHRDITPANLMVHEGRVYIVDFGAAKIGLQDSTSFTTIGTFGYMAPEQMLGRADIRSDLYGLGMSFVTMVTGLEPSALPQDPSTGAIDPRPVLRVRPEFGRTLLALIRPGVAERLQDARTALTLLDCPVVAPPPAVMPVAAHGYGAWQGSGLGLGPHVQRLAASPYQYPEALSDDDKRYMREHRLQRFPVWAAVMLHYLTFSVFSIIHFGDQHGKLPRAVENDPSSARAIGFSFIPYFNLYWGVFNPLRLADRLNLQYRIRGKGDGVSRGWVLACAVLGVIPYINLLFGIPLWGVGVYKLQRAINRLADEADAEQAALAAATPYSLPPAHDGSV